MSQVYKFIVTYILILVLGGNANAQTDLGGYFLEGTWAARALNVTDTLKGNFEIYLPGLFLESHHSNRLSTSDLLTSSGGRNVLNFSNLIDQLEDNNIFENNLKINTIGIGFKLNSFFIDIKHNTRLNSRIAYPIELAKLIFEGNSQFIGETVNFGPSIDYFAYHEYSLGVSKEVGAFSFGGRVKFLSGIGFVQTDQNQASLFTDDDIFQLTFQTDYVINTANTVDIDGLSDFAFNTDFTEQFFSKNNGVAFDFGVSFKVNEKLKLTASILDIGAIQWDVETSRYASQGDFTYDGFDLNELLLNDSVEFEVQLDTLEEIFAFEESSTEVKTNLGVKLYLAGQYQLNEKLSLGALVHMADINENDFSIGINAQYRFGKAFLLGLNYNYYRDSFSNLGLQFSARLGPFVVFGNTDNIISVLLRDNFALNGRIGLGLSF